MFKNTLTWIGSVENNDDPEKRGRIQVRVFGAHDVYSNANSVPSINTGRGIPTEDLPWALCMFPVTYGGTPSSTVPPPQVQPGAWVIGISLDGEMMQQLLVFGVLPNNATISDFAKNDPATSTAAMGIGMQTNRVNGVLPQIGEVVAGSGTMTFEQLFNGIIKTESDGRNGLVSPGAACYGLTQMHVANAASMVLNGEDNGTLEAAGLSIKDPETKSMLQKMKTCWSRNSVNALANSDPKAKEFIDTLQWNADFNMALGRSYLKDCLKRSNNDPVMACMYYNQGIGNVSNIFSKAGIDKGGKRYPSSVPTNMSYSEFLSKVSGNEVGLNDIPKYVNKTLSVVGGLENIEKNGRIVVKG